MKAILPESLHSYLSIKRFFVLLAVLAIAMNLSAQPDYDFRNPALISGTNLALNAKYRFANVKTGIDAIVTIKAFSGGASLNQLDAPSGYAEAFQPVIFSPGNSNSYVEFRIQFVTTGTSAASVMPIIYSTSLDIDATVTATERLFEYDMVELTSASSVYNFDMNTTELAMSSGGGWVTGKNVAGNNYSGVDTSVKNVMFTVANYNASSFSVRMGADNQTGTAVNRNKSIYFANFKYSSGLLSRNELKHFSGIYDHSKVLLEWQVENAPNMKSICVERSATGKQYAALQHYDLSGASNKTCFELSDYMAFYDRVYYRLKIANADGSVHYSKTLIIYSPANSAFIMNVYAGGLTGRPSVQIHSPQQTPATMTIVDMAGNVKLVTRLNLIKGKNNVTLQNSALLKQGYHIAILQVGKTMYTNKFLAQDL